MILLKKYKTLPTLNTFVNKNSLEDIKKYNQFLRKKPKRTDFINYDSKGKFLNCNKPIFKGWFTCQKTSNETIKVAKKGNTRLYFDTKDGVIIVNHQKMSDNSNYNDLAIFFNGKLKLQG